MTDSHRHQTYAEAELLAEEATLEAEELAEETADEAVLICNNHNKSR